MVLTPQNGSCFYSCIWLGTEATSEQLREWQCAHRHANSVAKDAEREAFEKKVAQEIADRYQKGIDAEKIPEEWQYEDIAKASDVTVDVFMLHKTAMQSTVNPGAKKSIKALYVTTSNKKEITEGTGHFHLLVDEPLIGADGQGGNWGGSTGSS